MPYIKSLYYKSYKDDQGFFGSAGGDRYISCDHENMGLYWINTKTEEVGVLGPPAGYNEVQEGSVTPNPERFSDVNFKQVYKIFDRVSGITTYVDKTSFDTIIIQCNPISYPSICSVPTGLATGALGTTTATIIWTAGTNATGYEWVNQSTPSTQPVIAGTFASGTSVSLTGLTTAHAYRFWIRTICGAGFKSDWVSFNFTTA